MTTRKGWPPFRLFKLHGSVNWGRVLENRFPSTELQPSDRLVVCDPSTMRSPDIGYALFPAIAIPVEKKSIFECPPYMIEELKSVLHHVTKTILIGWRATEDHFLNLLRENLKPGAYLSIVAANQSEAEEIRVRMQSALPKQRPSASPEPYAGFTAFMRSGRAQTILAG